MMVAFEYLSKELRFDNEPIHTLVIENKQLYTKVILSFENEIIDEIMTFSKDFKPFDFDKHCVYISNPVCPQTENRKLATKINSYLESLANNEYSEKLNEIKNSLTSLASELTRQNDFDFTFNDEIDTKSIIKLLEFSVSTQEDNPALTLVRYITLVSKYLKTQLFVIANLHLYFSKDDIEAIFKTLSFYNINLLLLECVSPTVISNGEVLHIIDNDLISIEGE